MPNIAIAFNYMFPTNVATKKKKHSRHPFKYSTMEKEFKQKKNNSTQDATHTQ